MAEAIKAVTWEAPEHHHIEKRSDWFWVLGILAIAGAGVVNSVNIGSSAIISPV